jgi:hypothetical protein
MLDWRLLALSGIIPTAHTLRKFCYMSSPAATAFREWLDTVSDDLTGTRIVLPEKSLDERVADKEKRIKRKIEARMRRERAKGKKRLDSQLTPDDITCKIEARLFQ